MSPAGSKFLQFFLVISALLLPCATPSPAFAIEIGESAPDFNARSFQNEEVSLSAYRGKIVYLDFWASWCVPCRKTLPWMETLHQRYQTEGLVVITVNLDSNRDPALKLLKESAATFLVVADPDGEIASQYSLPGMPSSYLVDRAGVVRAVFKGFSGQADEVIESELRKELIRK